MCYLHIHFRREKAVPQAMIYDSISGCTNLRYVVAQVSKFYAVVPNISIIKLIIYVNTTFIINV